MKKHYLLTFTDNYADEFDANGSVIIDEDQYKYFYSVVEQAVKSEDYSQLDEDYTSDVYVGLGSNEDIEYEGIADLMNQVECTELTEEEYKVLKKFGFDDYGFTSFWDTIAEAVASDDEDEDEKDSDD
jgi:hypothetical protein